MQATEVLLPDQKCDPCTLSRGSSLSVSSLTKIALLFPYKNVHHVEALTGTCGCSRADVQVDYLRVEMELQGLWTDPRLFGLKWNNGPNIF